MQIKKQKKLKKVRFFNKNRKIELFKVPDEHGIGIPAKEYQHPNS